MAPDTGGEESHRPPPHPLDRIWMHPSEQAGTAAPPPRRRRWVPTAFLAATTSLALAVGVLAVVGIATDVGAPGSGQVAAAPLPTESLAAAVVLVTATSPLGPVSASGVSLGDGQIVTASQVAAHGAITVTTTDSAEHEAEILGHDHESDLVLLRVDTTLPAAPLGRADLVPDDAELLAITATGVDERWTREATLEQRHALVRTDSGEIIFAGLLGTNLLTSDRHAGGALVDGEGNVVGVLVTPPGTSTTGAAVPIERVTGICDQLRRRGHADHGWLGLAGADTSAGVRVHAVAEEGPAALAGIRAGDLVVAAGNTKLSGVGELAALVRARRPGDDLHIDLWREGRPRSVEVTLASLDPDDRAMP